MIKPKISAGVVHEVPADFQKALLASRKALENWEDVTPLARNEWICWIESVKKRETRTEHLKMALSDLAGGKRRPCCWSGCPHR